MVQEQVQRVMAKSPRQTRRLVQRLGKISEAQAAMGWGLILILAALLGAIYLNQTSKIAATGRQIQELRFELSQVQAANAALESEIAAAQTLERLQQAAAARGFQPATAAEVEYLVIPDLPPAEDPLLTPLTPVATPEPLAEPPETIVEALGLTLRATLDNLMRGEYSEQ